MGVIVLAYVCAGTLTGCAVYEKCGLAGCPGDKQISAEVETLFSQHGALEVPNELHVQTLDRVVYLTGLVNSPREQDLATQVAFEAPGVANVVNSIGLYNGR